MIYKQFYSELGKLLYAIADIDGVITPEEKKMLENIVKKELVPVEQHEDGFGTDAAYYTEIEFEFLDEAIADPEAAFESFIAFIERHHTAFDSNLKKVAMHITKELANAYRGTNKKEKRLINILKQKLETLDIKNETE
jgi:hypothetical protein